MRKRILVALLAASRLANAQPDPAPAPVPEPEPAPGSEPAPPTDPVPTPAELAKRIEDLELSADHAEVIEQRVQTMGERIQTLLPLRRFISAYIDVGWFAVGGDGSGVRRDIGHREIRDYEMVPAQWVLLGDPLSTAINALGEPADLGVSRALKTDTVNSEGHPGFIVNSLALDVSRTVGKGFSISALAELLPRPGPDILEVELAHIDYRPTNQHDLVLSVGKVDSVLGVEYRSQDAPRRMSVTPSLTCRYTCGRPYGIQARLIDGRLSASAALTNGDNFAERFEPDRQISFSKIPTAAGHVQWMLPVGQGLEVGLSGAVGPQDDQSSDHVHQWHYGVDLRLLDYHDVEVVAEFVQGKQQGSAFGAAPTTHCTAAECLAYKAAYALVDWRANRWLTPYVRIDWRSARHQDGIEFLYVTRTLRATVGLHAEITPRILVKAEYTANRELGTFQFPNDVFTSSLVVSTE